MAVAPDQAPSSSSIAGLIQSHPCLTSGHIRSGEKLTLSLRLIISCQDSINAHQAMLHEAFGITNNMVDLTDREGVPKELHKVVLSSQVNQI